MRWTSDDYDSRVGMIGIDVPDYPADIEVMGYFEDPMLSAEIDEMIRDAELMGIDLEDPELMGAFKKGFMKKLVSRLKKRKKEGTLPTVSIDTGKGTAALGPGGMTWTDKTAGTAGVPAATGGITDMLKNPFVLAGIGGTVLLLIMMSKKKRGV